MSADAVTLDDITSADWSLKLGAIGQVVQGIEDVEQCLGIIVATPQGSDPLRPTFGSNIWRFIDHPINAALPAIVSELTTAITTWEPRVTMVSVTVAPLNDGGPQAGAHIDVTLNWQLKLGAAPSPIRTTVVALPGGPR